MAINSYTPSGISVNAVEMPITVVSGSVATTIGVPIVLNSDTTRELTGVQIKALPGNTGTVYLGTHSVTASNGYQLEASNELFINVSTLANLYIDVSVGGEGIVYYAQVKTVPAPTVTGIAPASGSDAGGNDVEVTGTNFIGVTSVTIGGATCTSIITASDISITAVSPAGIAGAQDVVVTTAYGTGTLVDGFTYSSWSNTKSIAFDGTTDSYTGDSTDTTASGTAVCVSFWFKVASVADSSSAIYYLVTSVGSDHLSRFEVYAFKGGLAFQMASTIFVAAPLLSADTWHHCVAVYHGSGGAITNNMTLYLDGSSIADLGSGTSAMDIDTPWSLGRLGGSVQYELDGSLDEVGIYTGAILSAANVTAIYNGGTPTDLREGPHSASLRNYYRMGDDAGDSPSTLIDQQGNIDCTGAGDPVIETDVPT